ncbi:MAG: hypothetical protein GX587_10815, partial [Bacteroidales bacterium]|nr:hypothetical protein [Bacteroidales bacterium]
VVSCKREDLNISENEFTIKPDYDDLTMLNLKQNKIAIRAYLIPEITNESNIDVKVSSNADPDGYILSVPLKDGTYFQANTNYHYRGIETYIFAANHSDSTRKFIKVNAPTDAINISIGDNIYSKAVMISSQEILSMTYWPESMESTLFLWGLKYQGDEQKNFECWTSYNKTPKPFTGIYNNPMQYQNLPEFENFSVDLTFTNNLSSSVPDVLKLQNEGDTVFIKYAGKTYYSLFKRNTFAPLGTLR